MGTGHSPRNKKDRRLGDNVVSLRHPGDEFFDLLSPLLEETATFKDDELPVRDCTTFCRSPRRMPGFARLRLSYRTSSETSLFASGRMPLDLASIKRKRFALSKGVG